MPEWITLPGHTEYSRAIKLMEQKLQAVIEGSADEAIFLLEHHDVYTAGTSFNKAELLEPDKFPVIYTGRGGKFTYHGPGQLIIYPILDLRKQNCTKDIKLYVRNLEKWIINTLAQLNVKAYTIKDMVGIWVELNNAPAKIAAIGVRVRKWVTYHGVAVNISTNIENYSGIIPCGIDNFSVTSLNKLGVDISVQEFSSILKEEFNKIF